MCETFLRFGLFSAAAQALQPIDQLPVVSFCRAVSVLQVRRLAGAGEIVQGLLSIIAASVVVREHFRPRTFRPALKGVGHAAVQRSPPRSGEIGLYHLAD